MKHPRVPSLRADSGSAVSSPSRAAPIPPSLARFIETLGIADDPVWKPTHEGDEPPW